MRCCRGAAFRLILARYENQNDQLTHLRKYISRSFGCGSPEKPRKFPEERLPKARAQRARLSASSLRAIPRASRGGALSSRPFFTQKFRRLAARKRTMPDDTPSACNTGRSYRLNLATHGLEGNIRRAA